MTNAPLIDLTPPEPGTRIRRLVRIAGRTFGQVIGLPDYEAYLAHRRANHPDEPLMSREAFYRNRQEARFSNGQGRCCC
jgi:uncharacterized short protein YbdD (DUF466 family)